MTPGTHLYTLLGNIPRIGGQGIATGSVQTVECMTTFEVTGTPAVKLVGSDWLYGLWRFRLAKPDDSWKPPREPEPTAEEMATFEAARERLMTKRNP